MDITDKDINALDSWELAKPTLDQAQEMGKPSPGQDQDLAKPFSSLCVNVD